MQNILYIYSSAMEGKQSLEKELYQFLTSGKIEEIKLYQVNEYYYDLSKKLHWIIDGGIEFKFPHGFFSVAWSSFNDSFHYEAKPIREIYTADNIFELEEGEVQKIKDFTKEKIVDVKFKWQEYDVVLDYTMKTKKEFRLVEVKLEFSYKRVLQISTIDYSLDTNNSPVKYVYWIVGGLLLSLKELDIKEEAGGLRPEY